jgi:predicted O-methyltransferase YrrM
MTESSTERGSSMRLGPDRFAEVAAAAAAHAREHGCNPGVLDFASGRDVEVLCRALRASYVLELDTGLGYLGLFVAQAFGYTGHLDTVEHDPGHANLAEQTFRRFGYGERVRVHRGNASEIVPALNGPYDLILLHGEGAARPALHEQLVRLVRIGGSLLVYPPGADAGRAYADVLAADYRLLTSFPPGLERMLAVRTR